jgi:phosphoribosyl 1,2-cyclic phosphate phosphodiesterase
VEIEVLGAGGATSVPRPFCNCRSCALARQHGAPHTRYGPSLYIHDLRLLVDTPEEIGIQLNRANIARVDVVLYSHWHPDHTAGSRVFESNYAVNSEFWALQPERHCTTIFLAERVARTFEQNHGLRTRLNYLQRGGVIIVQEIPAGGSVRYQEVTITPIDLEEDIACSFLLEHDGKRVLICMDETFCWTPPEALGKLDMVFMPAGIFEFHPLSDEHLIPAAHPILKREATFAQTLEMVRSLNTPRVVFLHLGHADQLTYDDYRLLEQRLSDRADGLPRLQFAYDGLRVTV